MAYNHIQSQMYSDTYIRTGCAMITPSSWSRFITKWICMISISDMFFMYKVGNDIIRDLVYLRFFLIRVFSFLLLARLNIDYCNASRTCTSGFVSESCVMDMLHNPTPPNLPLAPVVVQLCMSTCTDVLNEIDNDNFFEVGVSS